MTDNYRTTSVRGVIRNGDSILVEWFAPKSISFLPGGTVESGEDLESTIVRELAEELQGLEFQVSHYLGKIGHFWKTSGGTDSCLNHFYEVDLLSDSGVSAREQGREIRWLSLKDPAADSLTPPSLRKLLSERTRATWDLVDDER